MRRVLRRLGFSFQRPRRKLARADPEKQRKWASWTYPRLKSQARSERAALVFTVEATFRVDPTLQQTWARRGRQRLVPTTGKREAEKVLGAVDLFARKFTYRYDQPFNTDTYAGFLEQLLGRYFPTKIRLIHS